MKKLLFILLLLTSCVTKEIVIRKELNKEKYDKYVEQCMKIYKDSDQGTKDYYTKDCSREAIKFSYDNNKYMVYRKGDKIVKEEKIP